MKSIRGQKMLANSPRYYDASRVFRAHIDAKGTELDNIDAILSGIETQFSASTATWGIRYWEELCGLPVNISAPIEIRRARVLARLLSSDGARPFDLQKVLAALGFDAFIDELFRSVSPLPIYDGKKNHASAYRTGAQWAMFRLRINISDFRDFLPADREEIVRLLEEIKPAHMALAGMDIVLPMADNISPVTDGGLIAAALQPTDLFMRDGLRHSGKVEYLAVPQHDARFYYNHSMLRHNMLAPGVVLFHRCDDESSTSNVVVGISDSQRILADHTSWPRLGLYYKGAAAIERFTNSGRLIIAEHPLCTTEDMHPVSSVNLADHFLGALLAHGPRVSPRRDGSIIYHSRVDHRPTPPRAGKSLYGDRILRLLGPRRDGRSRYGRSYLEQSESFGVDLTLADRQAVALSVRNGKFFYRDSDIKHGPGPAALDVTGFTLQVTDSDSLPLPNDQVVDANTKVILAKDGYPGCKQQHGAPDQALHDARLVHRLGSYAWTGDRYNGRLRHSLAPGELLLTAQANVSVGGDVATGYYLYGGKRALHDAGGPRWRHIGNLLRKPFAVHNDAWSHNGDRRYLEARSRYGDRAALRDGLDQYGVSGGLHNGDMLRLPIATPEDLRLVARRGYRRIAV